MTLYPRALFAMLILILFAGPCWGQRGIPPIRFSPPPRIPFFHPIPVHGHSANGGANGGPVDPIVIIVILAVAAVAIIAAVMVLRAKRRKVAHLRIVRTPPGEAPEEIRQAWVGVELPLRKAQLQPNPYPTVGVLSHQPLGTCPGYAVDGRAAIKALAAHSRDAAAWWRQNAPHVLASGYQLWFPLDVFEPLEQMALGNDGAGGVWQRDVAPWEK